MKRKHRDYQESLLESLKDTKEAIAYLNAALADDDPRVFLLALKDVLTAQDIDITSFAEESGITRQNIYRIFSTKGNPRWGSLTSLLNVLGLQIHLAPKKNESFIIDKKLHKRLATEASKHGISLNELINEKLRH